MFTCAEATEPTLHMNNKTAARTRAALPSPLYSGERRGEGPDSQCLRDAPLTLPLPRVRGRGGCNSVLVRNWRIFIFPRAVKPCTRPDHRFHHLKTPQHTTASAT